MPCDVHRLNIFGMEVVNKMRKTLLKLIVTVLGLVLTLCLLSGCGSDKASAQEAMQEENVDSAMATIEVDGRTIAMEDVVGKTVRQLLDEVGITLEEGDLVSIGLDQTVTENLTIQILRGYGAHTVTVEADGKRIDIEDTKGKTVQQLVDEAGVTLNKGDVLAFEHEQVMTGNLVIRVLRKCTIQVVVVQEEPLENLQYTVVLIGGTVSDAIEAVGVQLAENQKVDHELSDDLKDGMTIVITTEEEEEEIPESSVSSEDTSYSDFSSGSDSSSGSGSSSASGSGSSTGTQPSTPPAPPETSTETPPEPPVETPEEEEVYEVSRVQYEDCDGSGHGVWVITYSDGSQEEVPY